MQKRSRTARYRLVGLLFLACLFGARLADASAPAPNDATQKFEIRFMENTIDHHLLGVAMAQLCIERTTPPPPPSDEQLVSLCEQIAAAQQQEAETLRTWLADWYGIQHEGRIRQAGVLRRLERLGGEEFDIAVSEASSITRHRSAMQPTVFDARSTSSCSSFVSR